MACAFIMPLISALIAGRLLLDQVGAARQHAVGVALAVDVGAVREHVRALDVVEQRGAVGLDGADPVERAGLEGFDRLGRRCPYSGR